MGSHINWDEMLAGLEQQRTAIADELADVDAVIDTVRLRAGNGGAAKPRATAPKKKSAPKAVKANGGQGGRIDDATLAPIRKQYEGGVDIDAIAKTSGRSRDLIYYYAKS